MRCERRHVTVTIYQVPSRVDENSNRPQVVTSMMSRGDTLSKMGSRCADSTAYEDHRHLTINVSRHQCESGHSPRFSAGSSRDYIPEGLLCRLRSPTQSS